MFASAAIDQIEERQVSRAENKLFTLLQLLLTACYCRTEREKNEQRKSQNTNPLKGQGKIGSCTVVGLWQSKQTSQALAAANQ